MLNIPAVCYGILSDLVNLAYGLMTVTYQAIYHSVLQDIILVHNSVFPSGLSKVAGCQQKS